MPTLDLEASEFGTVNAGALEGPWRQPHQLLSAQQLVGAGSIHDDATALGLGLPASAIEGPTHFSQFVPLCARAWGRRWFENGGLSVKYKVPCFAGEELRAALEWPVEGMRGEIWLTKRSGAEALRGFAFLGDARAETMASRKALLSRRGSPASLHGTVRVGMKSERHRVRMMFDEPLGSLYPFSLSQKLDTITEPSPWYSQAEGHLSPWGRPVIPFEMISVLLRAHSANFPFPPGYPLTQMFAAQEIRLIDGPLFVGNYYEIEHSVVGLAETRDFEATWIQSLVFDEHSRNPVAQMLLNMVGWKKAAR